VFNVACGFALNVIAAGIEQREQRDFLALYGCDAYQRYAAAFAALLERATGVKDRHSSP